MTQVELTQQLSLWKLQRELDGVLNQLCYLLIQVCYLPSFTLIVFYSQPRGCQFNSLVYHSINRSSYSWDNSWQVIISIFPFPMIGKVTPLLVDNPVDSCSSVLYVIKRDLSAKQWLLVPKSIKVSLSDK